MSATTKIYCPKCGHLAQLGEEEQLVPYLCQGCGHDFVAREREGATSPRPQFNIGPAGREPTRGASTGSDPRAFGIVLIVMGALVFLFFAFIFETTVTVGDLTVNNEGLMNDRLIGCIAGALITIVGAILAAASPKK